MFEIEARDFNRAKRHGNRQHNDHEPRHQAAGGFDCCHIGDPVFPALIIA
jgi:hypothetical protein